MNALQAQLPALLIVVPLLAAPVCALVRGPAFAWGFATVVSAASFVVATALAAAVSDGSEIAYLLGGWAAPWGIEYRIDALNALVVVIVAGASTVSLVHARLGVAREVRRERIGLFYTAWLLCLTGMLGIAITGDVFNVFVFLEIASLSTYVLVALGPGPAALLASFRYLVLGSIGATFFLVGIGLLYMMTGTLNMADLSARLGDVSHTRTVAAGVVFVVLGIGLKAAVFPLHAWLPAAYAHAPGSAAAFLAGTSTKVSVYVLVRFLFDIFGVELAFERLGFGVLLVPLAVAGCWRAPRSRCSRLGEAASRVVEHRAARLHGAGARARHRGRRRRLAPAPVQPRGDEGRALPRDREPGLSRRVGRAREPRGARTAHALDDGLAPGRRDEHRRRASHRRVRVEVVPAPGRAGGRDVADRGRHPGVVAARRGVHVAGGERRVLHRGPPRHACRRTPARRTGRWSRRWWRSPLANVWFGVETRRSASGSRRWRVRRFWGRGRDRAACATPMSCRAGTVRDDRRCMIVAPAPPPGSAGVPPA